MLKGNTLQEALNKTGNFVKFPGFIQVVVSAVLKELLFMGYAVEIRKDDDPRMFVVLANGAEDVYAIAIG